MTNSEGKKRIVIGNVLPSVDDGSFAAKAIVNRPTVLSANVFIDGHDEVRAEALIRRKGEKPWNTLKLSPAGNDVWSVSFTPRELGIYQFQVQGWVSHFATWQKGLQKKYEAEQDIQVEIQKGIQLAEGAAGAARKPNPILLEWVRRLQGAPPGEGQVTVALEPGIAEAMEKCVNKAAITVSEKVYELMVEPREAEYSTWYELFPRSAARVPGMHGTFEDVKNLLPRISNMGFDVLYLPPIHPIGTVKRKGRNNSLEAAEGDPGSPWAIGNKQGGHKAIHPALGTLKDFKSLVSATKKCGIGVAMDIAFQCAPDHPYVSQHPEWFLWRPDGTVQYAENPPKKYEDILPFNFECDAWESLWEELKSIFIYWREKGVSIFRVDNPHTKPFPFWEWVIKEIKQDYPDTIFLAEAFTRPRLMERLAKLGFSQSYTYFAWRNTKKELEEYVTELAHTSLRYYFRPNFWPNTPDILTKELVEGKENAHIIRLLLAATLSPSYGIYGPVFEYGICEPRPGKEEYTEHWDWDKYTKIKELIIRINRIRRENTALQSMANVEFVETSNEHIICYIKTDEANGNMLIIAINLDPFATQAGHVNIPLARVVRQVFSVHDLLSGDKYEWKAGWNYVSLNPYDIPGHVFRIQQ